MDFKIFVLASVTAIAATTVSFTAKADAVDARCDLYPLDADQSSTVTACTFSQRQGAVGIQLESGRRYDLTPVGNQAKTAMLPIGSRTWAIAA